MDRTDGSVTYTVEKDLSAAEFVDVLKRSGLAERRPVNDARRIASMLRHANLVVCARDREGTLIGVSRALTDFAFCCYLSDLAVDRAWQGRGVGRELMHRTHQAAGGTAEVTLLLLSAPGAMTYYPQAGLNRLENCFGWARTG